MLEKGGMSQTNLTLKWWIVIAPGIYEIYVGYTEVQRHWKTKIPVQACKVSDIEKTLRYSLTNPPQIIISIYFHALYT